MKRANFKAAIPSGAGLSPDLLAQLQMAAGLPDDRIDTGDPDAPEVADWSGAVRGRFYKPVKQLKSLRVDADVLAIFRRRDPDTRRGSTGFCGLRCCGAYAASTGR